MDTLKERESSNQYMTIMGDKKIETLLGCLAKNGVCPAGQRYLNGTRKDMATLVRVWRGWPEYLYEHSALALALFRRYLDDDDRSYLARESIFLDFSGTVTLGGTTPVFFTGDSEATITMDGFATAKIYLFNNSRVTIRCNKNALLNIETFDDSRLDIVDGENGECVVYQYDSSTVGGVARIKRKEYIRGEVFNGNETGYHKTSYDQPAGQI